MVKTSPTSRSAAPGGSCPISHHRLSVDGPAQPEAIWRVEEGELEPLVEALRRLDAEDLKELVEQLQEMLRDAVAQGELGVGTVPEPSPPPPAWNQARATDGASSNSTPSDAETLARSSSPPPASNEDRATDGASPSSNPSDAETLARSSSPPPALNQDGATDRVSPNSTPSDAQAMTPVGLDPSVKLASPKPRRVGLLFAFGLTAMVALLNFFMPLIDLPLLAPHPVGSDISNVKSQALSKGEAAIVVHSTTNGTQIDPSLAPIRQSAEAQPTIDLIPSADTGPTMDANGRAPARATPVPPPNEIEALVSRGDQYLGTGDVASARLFYERAAAGGSAAGATGVARTFDPLFLAVTGARGLRGDRAQAISWYRKASAAGDLEAENRLRTLLLEPE